MAKVCYKLLKLCKDKILTMAEMSNIILKMEKVSQLEIKITKVSTPPLKTLTPVTCDGKKN